MKIRLGGLKGKTVPLHVVQEAAVLKDRRIWLDDHIAGKWYEDHMLDYVRENKDMMVFVSEDKDTILRVRLATSEEELVVKQFHEVMDALEKLGYDTEKKEVVTRPVAEGDKDRVVVKLDGEQFGIYDFVKHTFID